MQKDNQHNETRCRIEMLERAASYPGRARERLLALAEADEICARLCPQRDQEIRAIRVAARALPVRPQAPTPGHDVENHLIDLLRGLVEESLNSGDLQIPEAMTAEQAAVAVWALAFGQRAVHVARSDGDRSAAEPTAIATRRMAALLADSLTWHPLSSEWDYRRTRDRVLDYLGTVEAPRPHTAARQTWHKTGLAMRMKSEQ